jgi:hypothetical protein
MHNTYLSLFCMAKFGSWIASIVTAAALSVWNAPAAQQETGFSDVVAAGWPSIERVFTDTRTATTGLIQDTQPILLAQAQETDGKVYVAEVIQIDGTKKKVQYTKNVRWAIIAPPVVDGKLVDGSKAPENTVEARIAQKDILVKYDRMAQIMLASVSKEDIYWEADKTLKEILAIAEQWKSITKSQLSNWFYSAYIYNISLWNWKWEGSIAWLESIAKIKMKMSDTEVNQMKQEARLKAINVWKSVTWALAIG